MLTTKWVSVAQASQTTVEASMLFACRNSVSVAVVVDVVFVVAKKPALIVKGELIGGKPLNGVVDLGARMVERQAASFGIDLLASVEQQERLGRTRSFLQNSRAQTILLALASVGWRLFGPSVMLALIVVD